MADRSNAFPKLSAPYSELRSHYDVVVVGSGYGGAIAASRLSAAGQSVCVLERGREFAHSEFPQNLAQYLGEARFSGRVAGNRVGLGSRLGLFDFRVYDDLNVLVGSGLGGTSLINASVFLDPDPRVFEDPVWPRALREDALGIARAKERARAMLRPSRIPSRPDAESRADKRADLLRSAEATLGGEFEPIEVAIHFGDSGRNHVGVHQNPCNHCGNCAVGCQYRAKNDLTLNYLPDARRNGAQLFTGLQVSYVRKREDGSYSIHYRQQVAEMEVGQPLSFVVAKSVVLAAGALGSSEILLRSARKGLAVSSRVGRSFSANGNFVGFASAAPRGESAIGRDPRAHFADGPGPCITGVVKGTDGGSSVEEQVIVEDGVVPKPLELFMVLRTASVRIRQGLMNRDPAAFRGLFSRNHLTFMINAHDGAKGRVVLEPDADQVIVEWPGQRGNVDTAAFTRRIERLADSLGAQFVNGSNPLGVGGSGITVHPMGGCPMGESRHQGVVNHRCEVFDADREEPGAVHEGLYVCDMSVVPRSLGVNPSATLCAIVERACEIMVKERSMENHSSSAGIGSQPRPSGARVVGRADALGFTLSEVFHGWIASEYARDGADEVSRIELMLNVTIESFDGLLEDPNHTASLTGFVRCVPLSPEPLAVAEGTVCLLARDPKLSNVIYNIYSMDLVAVDGRRYRLTGRKVWRDGTPLSLWLDGTTLPLEIRELGSGGAGAPVLRGIVKMSPSQFLGSVRTYSALGAKDVRQRLEAQARFFGFATARIAKRLRFFGKMGLP